MFKYINKRSGGTWGGGGKHIKKGPEDKKSIKIKHSYDKTGADRISNAGAEAGGGAS